MHLAKVEIGIAPNVEKFSYILLSSTSSLIPPTKTVFFVRVPSSIACRRLGLNKKARKGAHFPSGHKFLSQPPPDSTLSFPRRGPLDPLSWQLKPHLWSSRYVPDRRTALSVPSN